MEATESVTSTPADVAPPKSELQPFADLSDAALAKRVSEAQALADKLATQAGELEQHAQAAEKRFLAEPNADTYSASKVQGQLGTLARDRANAAAKQAAELAAEADRRAKLRRLAELRPHADATAVIASAQQRAVQLVRATLDGFRAEADRLVSQMNARDVAAAELVTLAAELGVELLPGEQGGPMLADAILGALRSALDQTFGDATGRSPVQLTARQGTRAGSLIPTIAITGAQIEREADHVAAVGLFRRTNVMGGSGRRKD